MAERSQIEKHLVYDMVAMPHCRGYIQERLKADDFMDEDARKGYVTVLKIQKDGLEPTISQLENYVSFKFAAEMMTWEWVNFSKTAYREGVETIMEHLKRSRALESLRRHSVNFDNGDKPSTKIDAIITSLNQINRVHAQKTLVKPSEAGEEDIARLRDIFKGVKETFVKTGYDNLDKFGMLSIGKMSVLGGYTHTGKTTLALNILAFISKMDKVYMATLEMSRQELIDRLTLIRGELSYSAYFYGPRSKEFMKNYIEAFSELVNEDNIWINSAKKISPNDIDCDIMEMTERGEKPKLVVVDYIQKMYIPGYKGDRYLMLGEIAEQLFAIADKHQIPVLALAQLKRTDKEPTLQDLRESGNIEAEAYWVGLLSKNFDTQETKCGVEKNRNAGILGSAVFKVARETSIFSEKTLLPGG